VGGKREEIRDKIEERRNRDFREKGGGKKEELPKRNEAICE
jgi:hypothetical protein